MKSIELVEPNLKLGQQSYLLIPKHSNFFYVMLIMNTFCHMLFRNITLWTCKHPIYRYNDKYFSYNSKRIPESIDYYYYKDDISLEWLLMAMKLNEISFVG